MIDNDEVLESMQADILGILQHTPSLKGHVLADNEGDFNSRLEKSLGTKTAGSTGKRGLAIIVLQVDVTEAEKNLPGPPLKMRVRVLVIENIVINRSATKGTLQRSSQAALNILNTLQLAALGAHSLYADKSPIAPQTVPEGLSSHMVTLYVQSGMNPITKPNQVQAALTTVSTLVVSGATPSSVNGTYTQIADQNGLPAWSKDGDAVPEDGVEGIIYGFAGFWYLKREVYGVNYSAVVAIFVSTTPVGLTGWSITGGSGQPTLAAGSTTSTVALTCASPSSSIRYTTDGSFPSPATTLYTAPFALPAVGTVMRVAAYVADMPPSDVLEFTVRE